MILRSAPFIRMMIPVALVCLSSSPSVIWANPPEKGPLRGGGKSDSPKGSREGSSLTQEEREKIREVLSKVWMEPEVVAARESVHEATELYRNAVKAAVQNADPSVVPLMEKMHRDSKSSALGHRRPPSAWKRMGPPPPLPKDPEEALKRILESDAMLGPLSPEDRKRFSQLARRLMEEGNLQELLNAAIAAEEPPDTMRTRREFREALFQAMVTADPEFEEVIGRSSPGRDRSRRPEDRSPGRGDSDARE